MRKYQPKSRQPGLWGKDVLTIDRMSQEGRGIASRGGKIVFVSGALAGEQVRAQCTAVKRDYDEAELLELVTDSPPSAQRTQPECPIYQQCGGCSLQHWALPAQQQHAQSTLAAMLQPISPGLVLEPPILSQPRGYRHRLRLMVMRSGKNYVLGLRRGRSHEAIGLQHCIIANSAVNSLLSAMPDRLAKAPDLQGLREVDIDADSDDQVGLCFYFAANPGEKTLSALRGAMLIAPVVALRVRLIASRKTRNSVHDDRSRTENSATWQELYAEGELSLRLHTIDGPGQNPTRELWLAYQPGDFTQTQWAVNTTLVNRGLDWLKPGGGERALDLYSGIGNFTLPLALRAQSVHAIEGDKSMAKRVASNAERNGVENITAKTSDLMADEVTLPKADIAIIDPPRAGAKAVCQALARGKLKRLLYVSCHPATLVRDARVLHSAGLVLTRAAAVDMFPHTGHSEALVLFERS